MGTLSLVIPLVGAAAGVVAASAGVVGSVHAVRQFRLSRAATPLPPPASPGPPPSSPAASAGASSASAASAGGQTGDDRDVFVAYARDDETWARGLAVRLEAAGFTVWLDVWDVGEGDLFVERVEAGIRGARNALMIVGARAPDEPVTREEYAALMTRSIERGLRFIPVVHGAGELPEFLAARRCVDFRAPAPFEERFDVLVRALRGQRPARV
ncbi:toll/interleukin-1 receptor domain-containing protein [Actinomadura decatromicini]|uniref:Toll/interleukin-1 receptor domain-containing protein n=1 Tax=Actinomadura decatromicini TaxID=2604572 RepID=A0A5D3FXT9_9ACTN|nr:toll/interleukin-1 receptor domain-containing protein [Actinomadura decatromicini]TYK52829.1 toll/interleukin-1 receptor domain-containing protein [Actinomadura decatromicini]